jgi:hypothetical protein
MPNRLRRRCKRATVDALASLEQAFLAEATRQERERLIKQARNEALQNREATLQACPLSWPATMMQQMNSQYLEVAFKPGVTTASQMERS